jgi:NAD(P)-dependent dehydrogenase (short-subunit alcohol dehydrogenase family)
LASQQVALVTGASSGFGRLTAEAFAARGWRAYAAIRDVDSRNTDAATALRASGVRVVELDVADDASVEQAARVVLDEVGRVDVLVNNAGIGSFGIQEAFTPAAVEQLFAVNVVGTLRVNRAFLPSMRARRSGLVVYMSSRLGRYVVPFMGVYSSSKWALEALAEASSYELAPFGVGVAIVEPAVYPTGLLAKDAGPDDPDRVVSYGDVARYTGALNQALDGASQGRDRGDVAREIVRLAHCRPASDPCARPCPRPPRWTRTTPPWRPISANCCTATAWRTCFPRPSADPTPTPRRDRSAPGQHGPSEQTRRQSEEGTTGFGAELVGQNGRHEQLTGRQR